MADATSPVLDPSEPPPKSDPPPVHSPVSGSQTTAPPSVVPPVVPAADVVPPVDPPVLPPPVDPPVVLPPVPPPGVVLDVPPEAAGFTGVEIFLAPPVPVAHWFGPCLSHSWGCGALSASTLWPSAENVGFLQLWMLMFWTYDAGDLAGSGRSWPARG